MSVGNLVNYLKSKKKKKKGVEMHFEHHCNGISWGSWAGHNGHVAT